MLRSCEGRVEWEIGRLVWMLKREVSVSLKLSICRSLSPSPMVTSCGDGRNEITDTSGGNEFPLNAVWALP